MSPRRRLALTIVALAVVLGMVGCTVDGKPYPEGVAQPKGHVDTDRFDKLTLECQILSPSQIGKAVGGGAGARSTGGPARRGTGGRGGGADGCHLRIQGQWAGAAHG